MPRPSVPLLSTQTIVARALKIIDADGVAGLSMRRLAGELGVSGPSLYHHFVGKDEILDAIIDHINAQIELPDVAPDWEALLTSYAYQLRALLAAHPHIVEFVALRPVTRDSGLRIYNHFAVQLDACGWTASFGREVVLSVENLVYGAALMANAPDLDLTPEQEDAYPRLVAFQATTRTAPDDGFEVGFAAMLDGLRRLAAREKPGRW